MELPFPHGGEVDLPLEVAQLDLDAELATPHLLVGLRDHLLPFRGRIQVVELREPLAAGVTGFGEEATRFRGILFPARGRLEAAGAGGREMERGLLAGPQDLLGDQVPVDGHAERPADPRVGERLAGGEVRRLGALDVAVDPDEGGGEEGVDAQLRGLVRPELRHLVRRHGAGDVQFAAAERALFGEEVGDGAELHGFERDFLGVPIDRVLAHDHAPRDLPGLERERAAADHRAGPRPRRVQRVDGPELEDRRRVHRDPAVVADELEEVRDGVLELDDQRARVRRAEADGPEILGLARVEVLGPAHAVQHRAVFRAEARPEHALVAEEEVRRGDGVAVRPLGRFAQAEGPGLAVRRHRPALGDARDGVQVLRIVIDESLEEGAHDVAFAEPGDRLRVETRGLGHVVDDQVALGRLLLGGGASVAAADEQGRQVEQGGRPSERGAKHAAD